MSSLPLTPPGKHHIHIYSFSYSFPLWFITGYSIQFSVLCYCHHSIVYIIPCIRWSQTLYPALPHFPSLFIYWISQSPTRFSSLPVYQTLLLVSPTVPTSKCPSLGLISLFSYLHLSTLDWIFSHPVPWSDHNLSADDSLTYISIPDLSHKLQTYIPNCLWILLIGILNLKCSKTKSQIPFHWQNWLLHRSSHLSRWHFHSPCSSELTFGSPHALLPTCKPLANQLYLKNTCRIQPLLTASADSTSLIQAISISHLTALTGSSSAIPLPKTHSEYSTQSDPLKFTSVLYLEPSSINLTVIHKTDLIWPLLPFRPLWLLLPYPLPLTLTPLQ